MRTSHTWYLVAVVALLVPLAAGAQAPDAASAGTNPDDDQVTQCPTPPLPTLVGTMRIDDHVLLRKEHVGCQSDPFCVAPGGTEALPACGAGGDGERVSLVVDGVLLPQRAGQQSTSTRIVKERPSFDRGMADGSLPSIPNTTAPWEGQAASPPRISSWRNYLPPRGPR